jgi:hypothetical protein
VRGGGRDEALGPRVAADDAVEDDDVRRRDLLRSLGDVDDAPLDPIGEARLLGELARDGVVAPRQLEVHRVARAAAE